MRIPWPARAVLLGTILASTLVSGCSVPGGSQQQATEVLVMIISPADGSQVTAGEWMNVVSFINQPQGASIVTLLVNGEEIRKDPFTKPMAAGQVFQPWRPEISGKYTLLVRLMGSMGSIDSELVTVTVAEPVEAAIAIPVEIDEEMEEAPPPPTGTATETGTATPTRQPITATSTHTPRPTGTDTRTPVPPTHTATPTDTPTSTPTVALASVSGKVWRDENGNGIRDSGDSGIAGVTLTISGALCPFTGIQSTTTDKSGNFIFSGMSAGAHCVHVTVSTLPSIGGTWLATTSHPRNAFLSEGEEEVNFDFGFQPIIQ